MRGFGNCVACTRQVGRAMVVLRDLRKGRAVATGLGERVSTALSGKTNHMLSQHAFMNS